MDALRSVVARTTGSAAVVETLTAVGGLDGPDPVVRAVLATFRDLVEQGLPEHPASKRPLLKTGARVMAATGEVLLDAGASGAEAMRAVVAAAAAFGASPLGTSGVRASRKPPPDWTVAAELVCAFVAAASAQRAGLSDGPAAERAA